MVHLFPDDRLELINGEIVMAPPPDNFHIEHTLRIENLLIPFFQEIRAIGGQISGSTAWYAVPAELKEVWVKSGIKGPDNVCPDTSVCYENYRTTECRPPALLVIEVIAISSQREIDRDLISKPDIYAALEIPTYWVIVCRDKSVWVHTAPEDGKYTKRVQYKGRKKLPAPGLDFLTITPAQIFA
jgi:Uma2 family endonuclease